MISAVHRRLVLFHRTEQRLNRLEHSRIERGNDAGLHCEAWQRAQVRRMASVASVPQQGSAFARSCPFHPLGFEGAWL